MFRSPRSSTTTSADPPSSQAPMQLAVPALPCMTIAVNAMAWCPVPSTCLPSLAQAPPSALSLITRRIRRWSLSSSLASCIPQPDLRHVCPRVNARTEKERLLTHRGDMRTRGTGETKMSAKRCCCCARGFRREWHRRAVPTSARGRRRRRRRRWLRFLDVRVCVVCVVCVAPRSTTTGTGTGASEARNPSLIRNAHPRASFMTSLDVFATRHAVRERARRSSLDAR